jgi:flagellar biosynthesis protein FlhF
MIVASRKTEPDDDFPNAYEVVCGFTEKDAKPTPAPPPVRPAAPEPVQSIKPSPVAQIKRGLGAVKAVLTQPAPAPKTDEAAQWLEAAGFGDLVHEIVHGVERRLPEEGDVWRALRHELVFRLQVAPVAGRPRAARQVMAIVGPPGVGKTTTVAKIALQHGLMLQREVHLITLDAHRLGGPELLRSYASAMGTAFSIARDAGALESLLGRESSQRLTIIDTPGLSSAAAPEWAPLLSTQDVDVHLAVPAWASPADLAATVARFRHFLPSKLLLTGVDMAQSCMPAVAQSMRFQRPISFLSTGQEVPEHLENATPERLLGLHSKAKQRGAASAA